APYGIGHGGVSDYGLPSSRSEQPGNRARVGSPDLAPRHRPCAASEARVSRAARVRVRRYPRMENRGAMQQSVIDRWHDFSEPLEGRVSSMYLDVKGLVTCCVGNL